VRTLPGYGWFGLVVMLVSQAGMLARVSPFYHWHTPIAWTGYILFVDALVWKRRGASWLRNHPAEFLFLACLSVPLWVVFEIYNKYSIRNWYYVGLPEVLLLRYFGYAWSFATISPAIFETGDLVSCLRDRRAPASRGAAPTPQRLSPADWLAVALHLPRRPTVARLHPASRSAERTRRQRFSPRRLAGRTSRPAGQPAGRGGHLRIPVGILELLGRHEMDLQRADSSRGEDLRDADTRIRGVSALCGGMLRHVRFGAPFAMAGGLSPNRRLAGSASKLWPFTAARLGLWFGFCGEQVTHDDHDARARDQTAVRHG
jgi:hypothetical protein